MPLLPLVALVLAVLPVEWPPSRFGLGPLGAAASVGCFVVGLVALAALLSHGTVLGAAGSGNRSAVERRYGLKRTLFDLAALAGLAASLLLLGWGKPSPRSPRSRPTAGRASRRRRNSSTSSPLPSRCRERGLSSTTPTRP